MAIASLDDVRTHLPEDKFAASDGNNEINFFHVDVERLVKGYLSSVFSAATLAAWADPDSTPAYIRACAGRLVAAFYYAKKVSEDLPDWDRTYPQRLYDEAMHMLELVREGDVVLEEVDEVAGTAFANTYYFPTAADGDPKFTMGMRW